MSDALPLGPAAFSNRGPTAVFVDVGLSSVAGGAHQSRIGREEIGAQLVAACCQQFAKWSVRFIRPNTTDVERIVQAVQAGPFDIVVLFPYTYTKWLADRVASRFVGRVPVVYGGYHAGIGTGPHDVLQDGLADYVIAGRGEHALPELLSHLTWRAVPRGVKRAAPRVHTTETRYSLDELPWPLRDGPLMQDLEAEPLPFRPPAVLARRPHRCALIAGSIGCSARCDFCSSWMIAGRALHRSPKSIVDEMVCLRQRYGDGLIYHVVNPLFNADRAWVLTLCAEMERRGPFPTVCMPDFCLDNEMVRAMKAAGIFMVMMGLEFVDSRLRVLRGKREGDPARAYTLCAENGILSRAFLMLGRLGMSWTDVRTEVAALEQLPFRADQLRVNFEVPFPGTQVWHRTLGENIVTDQSRWTTEEVVYRTALSPDEWQDVRKEVMYAYHFGQRQQEHYERQVARFPELEPVYNDFLSRLNVTVASRPLGIGCRDHRNPDERGCGERESLIPIELQ